MAMKASKENARRALDMLCELGINYACKPEDEPATKFIKDFIEAALKRLPSERSYENDSLRRRAKKGG